MLGTDDEDKDDVLKEHEASNYEEGEICYKLLHEGIFSHLKEGAVLSYMLELNLGVDLGALFFLASVKSFVRCSNSRESSISQSRK